MKDQTNELIRAATEAQQNTYSPYSGVRVGSAVLMDNGKIYGGCNVENASYGATNCAERTAIFKAISEGAKKIRAIAVVTDLEPPLPPCGMCRQVISEFVDEQSHSQVKVIIANTKGKQETLSFNELFPKAMVPSHILD